MVDFCLTDEGGKSVINSETDLLIQQVDMLFDSTPSEVLGEESYGTTYDSYLYDTRISAANLQSIVESDLRSLNLMGWSFKVEVYLLRGTEQDIAIIDIHFAKGYEQFSKTYKIV